ncbi:MAG TPA: hypothetical protein PKH54_12665 [Myxococcota bacterium]|nr:hypothetical protein [Myxococcota bacterium]HOD00792.1 hypothetical protein [Myxococcota bacterium]HPV03779.1 hypothetical protein [Myxococcota bacterium]
MEPIQSVDFRDGPAESEGVRRLVADMRDRVFVRVRDSIDAGDGCFAIRVPRFDGTILGRFLMPRLRRPCFNIRLDRSGSFVWERIDGLNAVGRIAAEWAVAFPGERLPDARVTLFIRALAVQGHIREVDPEGAACVTSDSGR